MIIVCSLIATKSFGQQQQQQTEENPNAPVITFEETVRDFGKVPLNGVVEHEFTFTNTGKEPLVILRCSAPCTCTVPACPRDPIKPGEKGSITVKYTTTNYVHSFNRPFTISSNAKTPTVTITLRGEITNSAETAAADNK